VLHARATPGRLSTFSDGVFAVLMTGKAVLRDYIKATTGAALGIHRLG
jgi:hypothetical protein